MSSYRCHKAIFSFRADNPALASRCLTLKEGERVRVVYTEPLSGGHWCIAQATDGRFGLVPLFALCKTTEEEAFTAPPSAWEQIFPPEEDGSAALDGAGVGGSATRHADPTSTLDAFGISEADEIVHLLDQEEDERGHRGRAAAAKRDSLITVSPSTSEDAEEGDRGPPRRRCTAAALDFGNLGDSSGEEDEKQQRGWKPTDTTDTTTPAAAEQRSNSSNGSVHTDAGAEEEEVMARQSCHRSRGSSPLPAGVCRGTCIIIRKSKERGVRGAQQAQASTLAAWAKNTFERCWAQLPPLERSSETRRQLRELIQTQLACSWMETKKAELEKRQQQTRDREVLQQQEQREAALTAEQAQRALQRRCEAGKELLEELRRGGVAVPIEQLLQRNADDDDDDDDGCLRAEHITPIKERLVNVVLRRPDEDEKKKKAHEEAQMRAVLAADIGTFMDYVQQENKLQKRYEKVCSLQERLRAESVSLAVSEKALAAVVSPHDFELVPREAEGGEAAAATDPLSTPTKEQQQQQEALPPFRVRLLKQVQWPRTLAGLTQEEEEALRNYVRLYDKYELRYNDLQKKKRSKDDGSLDEKQLAKELEEWNQKLSSKMAEAAKMENEIKQRETFIAKYDAVAKKIEEQLQIGERVLAQKKAKLQKLTSGRS